MTIQELYNRFLHKLEQLYQKREAATISDWIFENVTGLKRLERLVQKNFQLNEQSEQQIEDYLVQLLEHRPVQYVLREAWFYKMKLYVNEHVLIPRPETEELVTWVLEYAGTASQHISGTQLQLLDIGTGSGCIAISLKKQLHNASIVAIDVSAEALSVAKKNADDQGTEIEFRQINFLDQALWTSYNSYDVIVSNPPYIPELGKKNLQQNVVKFEPSIALFVPNNNPFIFYQNIAAFARLHLKSDGKIFVEIHEDYSAQVDQIFKDYKFKTETKEDMYGKKRMMKASKFNVVSFA